MLSRDAQVGRLRLMKPAVLLRLALLAVVLAPGLAACGGGGFKPMYAAHGGQAVSEKMAQVSVTTIPGRVGQQLRNELIFRTTGGGGKRPNKPTNSTLSCAKDCRRHWSMLRAMRKRRFTISTQISS